MAHRRRHKSEMLTVQQIAAEFGITPRVVRDNMDNGRLKHFEFGPRTKRATREQVEEWRNHCLVTEHSLNCPPVHPRFLR